MKQWTVIYREKSGVKTSVVIEAEDRAGVFAELKQRGINAISITEGAVKAKRKATGGVSKGVWGVVAAVVAVALVAVVWVVMEGEEASVEVKKPKKERVEPEKAPVRDEVQLPKAKPTEKPVEKPVDNRPPHQIVVETISVITNADGSVLERFRTADGKIRSKQSAPRSVFDNSSDQLIAMAIQGANSPVGMPPMPISDSAEKDFVESLKKPIVINPDDSEEIKQLKQSVMAVRAEIDQMMKDGKSFKEIMKDHQALVNDNASLRKDVLKSVNEFIEKGDAEGAQMFLEKANETLGEMGIAPVDMPEDPETRRARIREQNRLRKETQK